MLLVATGIVIGSSSRRCSAGSTISPTWSRLGAAVEKLEARAADLLGERAARAASRRAPPADSADATRRRSGSRSTGYIAHIDSRACRRAGRGAPRRGACRARARAGWSTRRAPSPMPTWAADADDAGGAADCLHHRQRTLARPGPAPRADRAERGRLAGAVAGRQRPGHRDRGDRPPAAAADATGRATPAEDAAAIIRACTCPASSRRSWSRTRWARSRGTARRWSRSACGCRRRSWRSPARATPASPRAAARSVAARARPGRGGADPAQGTARGSPRSPRAVAAAAEACAARDGAPS